MRSRFARLLSALWVVAISVAPGQGWALCFESSGRVAVELTSPIAATTAECGTVASEAECPAGRCEACRDVSLDTPDRACPRREAAPAQVVAIAAVLQPMCLLAPVTTADAPRALLAHAPESPHLVRVLRC